MSVIISSKVQEVNNLCKTSFQNNIFFINKEISKFSSVNKDLAVVVDREIEAQTIAMQIKKSAGSILNEIKVFDVYTGKGIDGNKKSIAFSLNFGKMNATLTDEEINSAMEKIIKDLENKLGAQLRA